MPTKPQKISDRVAIINAVKTYLGFFVLIVLVVEGVLGVLAVRTKGQNQLVAICGMIFVVIILIVVVSFFAYRKPRALLDSGANQDKPELQDFCNRISGHWWERIKPDEPSAISFVEINPDLATNTIKMKGSSYNRDGELAAIWETVASCINISERKIFYYWKGLHPSRPSEPYEGFGEISFNESPDRIDRGVGFFSDTNITDMESTTRKFVEFQRSIEQDIQVLQEGNIKLISELIRKRLG